MTRAARVLLAASIFFTGAASLPAAPMVRFRAKDIGEVTRFLEFIDNYEAGLTP